MSGSQPAVGRSVVFGLSRHLQFAAPEAQLADSWPPRSVRPDASVLVEAVSNAAASILSRDEQIRHLEHRHQESEVLVDRMKSKLGELLRLQQTTDALAKAETERASRAEAKAADLEARTQNLEGDLDAALVDLHRIADVITGSFLTVDRL